jgi:hypothetical protein
MSKPKRTAYQLELFDPGHKPAMKEVQTVLSAEAALIAEKIPRIKPLLQMIERNGFVVVGLNEEPENKKPTDEEPVRLAGTSPGVQAFHNLLSKRGYAVARCTKSHGKAVHS